MLDATSSWILGCSPSLQLCLPRKMWMWSQLISATLRILSNWSSRFRAQKVMAFGPSACVDTILVQLWLSGCRSSTLLRLKSSRLAKWCLRLPSFTLREGVPELSHLAFFQLLPLPQPRSHLSAPISDPFPLLFRELALLLPRPSSVPGMSRPYPSDWIGQFLNHQPTNLIRTIPELRNNTHHQHTPLTKPTQSLINQ